MKSDKYLIQYNMEKPRDNPNEMFEIGRVIADGKLIASIVYCKNMYMKNKQHTCIVANGAFSEYEIEMDDLYYPLLMNNTTIFEALVMHEIGHLVNGDFESGETGEQAMDYRYYMGMKGMADEKELKADRFAVEHCGKNAVNKYLDYILKTRKERGFDNADFGNKEIELRKNAVKKL